MIQFTNGPNTPTWKIVNTQNNNKSNTFIDLLRIKKLKKKKLYIFRFAHNLKYDENIIFFFFLCVFLYPYYNEYNL